MTNLYHAEETIDSIKDSIQETFEELIEKINEINAETLKELEAIKNG